MDQTADELLIEPGFAPLLAAAGITSAADVFADPRIRVWRKLPDRENCTLDATDVAGQPVRLHVKRYPTPAPAAAEVRGYRLLVAANVPAAPIAASGRLGDGRTFVILPDLAGHTSGDRLLEREPAAFPKLLAPTADAAAQLHAAGLHHRDLYLGHFMLRDDPADVKLIDFARVRRLPLWPFRRRWIVKDLAQFWYSATRYPTVTEADRNAWLSRYADRRGHTPAVLRQLRAAVIRKAGRIARHDVNLNAKQPHRHVQVPPA